MKWLTDVLHAFGHRPTPVAKASDDPKERHSMELDRRAERTQADLQAVRRIQIIAERRR